MGKPSRGGKGSIQTIRKTRGRDIDAPVMIDKPEVGQIIRSPALVYLKATGMFEGCMDVCSARQATDVDPRRAQEDFVVISIFDYEGDLMGGGAPFDPKARAVSVVRIPSKGSIFNLTDKPTIVLWMVNREVANYVPAVELRGTATVEVSETIRRRSGTKPVKTVTVTVHHVERLVR